jgi:hypothetical protein
MLAIEVLFLCLILMEVVFVSMGAFAFSQPHQFVRWLSPLFALTRFWFRKNPDRLDRTLAYLLGSIIALAAMFLAFVLGGWLTTAFFHLWASPFSRIVFPE